MQQSLQSHKTLRFCTTLIGEAYHPCVLPLDKLKSITLAELRLETHHRERYLCVKLFCEPVRTESLQNGMQDELGFVERLAFFNVDPALAPSKVLPRGGFAIIKEPYYEPTSNGGTSLRVDHPSDLVLVDAEDPRVPRQLKPNRLSGAAGPTAVELKMDGNKAHARREDLLARQLYIRALDICPNDDGKLKKDLYRNRALTNFNLGRYEAAHKDALAAVIPDADTAETMASNRKAYIRSGKAEYELAHYRSAAKLFQFAI